MQQFPQNKTTPTCYCHMKRQLLIQIRYLQQIDGQEMVIMIALVQQHTCRLGSIIMSTVMEWRIPREPTVEVVIGRIIRSNVDPGAISQAPHGGVGTRLQQHSRGIGCIFLRREA